MDTCENCGRVFGKLETRQLLGDHVVCIDCIDRLRPRDTEPLPYRALGLETRGAAWMIAIIGFCLSPAIIGIPLAIWGVVADSMLRRHYGTGRGHSAIGVSAITIVLLFIGIFFLFLLYNNRL